MTDPVTSTGPRLIDAGSLGELYAALRGAGYRVVGPTVRDGAIVLTELDSVDELPFGWGVSVRPGGYRLRRRGDRAAFGHAAGPGSWKQFLHPPRARLWSADRTADGFEVRAEQEEAPRYAFLGVRPCDLRAIGIQDEVLGGGHTAGAAPGTRVTGYAARRAAAFIVAVNCTEPAETCFCAAMGSGPQAGPGFDLALTELTGGGKHRFLVDVGSAAGADILDKVRTEPAGLGTVTRARSQVAAAAGRMGRSMHAGGLRELLAASLDAKRWDDVASRCLTCGNCTMVCPTCFCTAVQDTTDLTGAHAERWESWDSCFDVAFSYVHGGSVRTSAASRYRQWLTHKLGTWHDQFGSSGCTGCGRCIVWCPAGIDLTEEVAALRAEAGPGGDPDPQPAAGAETEGS